MRCVRPRIRRERGVRRQPGRAGKGICAPRRRRRRDVCVVARRRCTPHERTPRTVHHAIPFRKAFEEGKSARLSCGSPRPATSDHTLDSPVRHSEFFELATPLGAEGSEKGELGGCTLDLRAQLWWEIGSSSPFSDTADISKLRPRHGMPVPSSSPCRRCPHTTRSSCLGRLIVRRGQQARVDHPRPCPSANACSTASSSATTALTRCCNVGLQR